jgi:hypothetical protein
MGFFTVEASGQPICTFAADDLGQAGQIAELEREDWTEIGALEPETQISVRQANIGEALVWKEIAAEAVEDGTVGDLTEAEESIIAFHLPLEDEGDDVEDDENGDSAA